MQVAFSPQLVNFWPFSRYLVVRIWHVTLVKTVVVASWAGYLLYWCLVKYGLVVTIWTAKRVLTITNLPREVTTVTRVMSVWYLDMRRETRIYSCCLRNWHVSVLVVTILIALRWRVNILIEAVFPCRSMHSTAFNWVWMMMLTRTQILSKYHNLLSVEVALVT
jgi:hypothetical protein